MTAADTADVAVIGGSGLYALLADTREVTVDTPYGAPSDPITLGEVGGRTVAFLPRHGRDHRYPPHRIPYRANAWALRSLGVQQILAPCAVGSLQQERGPGCLVVPDQLVDRTSGRAQTVHHGPAAVHVSFAEPYCPVGRAQVVAAARTAGFDVTDGGTMVVVEGPRFSTRAESQWYAGQGWSIVNMTGHPEAVLARELGVCYTAVALVTDLDAGVETGHTGVSQDEVFAVFAANTERLRGLLLGLLPDLPVERTCPCATALDGLTHDLPF
ncbi:MAG TPA: S-methyl-5'-thioadenosine phosphorylase [Frankiaceae bacterium]